VVLIRPGLLCFSVFVWFLIIMLDRNHLHNDSETFQSWFTLLVGIFGTMFLGHTPSAVTKGNPVNIPEPDSGQIDLLS